ncbi:MAG: primosomal protein N' [Gammaproteobacteria bacterium]|nr:primosomal protein N' [Gammaproteobacteria bacterium]
MSEVPLERYCRVAVPAPLRQLFDYAVPAAMPDPEPGSRVLVPFGRRQLVGVVVASNVRPDVDARRIKAVISLLDSETLLDGEVRALLDWVAEYYLAPPGEVYEAALPRLLRQPREAEPLLATMRAWRLSAAGEQAEDSQFKRAPVQAAIVARLRGGPVAQQLLLEIGGGARGAIARLEALGLLESVELKPVPETGDIVSTLAPPALMPGQQVAVDRIGSRLDGYHCHVLHGVTGSGKTEVYLSLIERLRAADRQVLVLVPEIGLTPQLMQRFRQRLGPDRIVVLHSSLTDTERMNAWLGARAGDVDVVIGTRSAVFVPLPRLGLIVVDEEHDASLKQQDGVRYHARDVAVMRAYRDAIPIVLGSATPSMESMHRCKVGQYHYLAMSDRAGNARLPAIRLLDMRKTSSPDGLSPQLVERMEQTITGGGQCIVYLNRRGFAPVTMCYDCGWISQCPRCEARLVFHKSSLRLRCHHCGHDVPAIEQCPGCGGKNLNPIGEGTEKLEASLAQRLPGARVRRLDRDTTTRRGELERCLADMANGDVDVLVGTQMLSKGHDFPGVTLVGVVNADSGLYSVDYRGTETLVQQVMQVAGRAGRAERAGEVLIQTWHPEHPVFHFLRQHDYPGFVDQELDLRETAQFPPCSYLAVLRAEAVDGEAVMTFLGKVYLLISANAVAGVVVNSPVQAPMWRRAGKYRGQLLIQAADRRPLHQLLRRNLPTIENLKTGRKVRWSLDIDPIDLY